MLVLYYIKAYMNERILPGDTTMYEYNNVEIICQTSTVPRWFFNKKKIGYDNKLVVFPSYNTLLLLRVPQSYGGVYSCLGSTESGTTFQAEMQLFVKGIDTCLSVLYC